MHRITCIMKGVPLCVALCLATGAAAEAAGPINVTQLTPSCASNADGSDGFDDTAAFTCAIGLVPAGGSGEIYVPAGTYVLSNQLTISGKSIAFRGEGQHITNLQFVNIGGLNGLDFSSTSVTTHQTFAVRAMSILRGNGEGGAAIHAAWPNTPSPPQPDFTNGGGVSITIEDVHIGSDIWTSNVAFWYRGIWLRNARFAKIHTFNIHGLHQATGGIAGIQISGSVSEGSGSPTIGIGIHDGNILGYLHGMYVGEGSQGLTAQNLRIRDALLGIQLIDMGAGTSISNCRITARLRGITAYNTAGDTAVSNNVIDRDGTEAFFFGIEFNRDVAGQAARIRVIGNSITATGSGDRYGISLANNITGAVVEGNVTHNMTIGIWVVNALPASTMVLGNINRGGTAISYPTPSTYAQLNW